MYDKALSNMLTATAEARQEAIRYRDGLENIGTSELDEYSNNNPLSSRAKIHLMLIEREEAAPDRALAKKIKDGHNNKETTVHEKEFKALVLKYKDQFSNLSKLKDIIEFDFYFNNYGKGHTLRDWVNAALPGHLKRGRPPNK